MINSVRLGDFVVSICPNIPSGPFYHTSTNTFINGRGAARLLDKSVPGISISGSHKTFINGRPSVRLIDKVLCGVITTASTNTFIG